MNYKTTLRSGALSGLVMGLALFLGGAVFARLIYGPQFAPPGKFDPEQLNPWFFLWTKIVIGLVFGMFFTLIYQCLPLKRRLTNWRSGLRAGFLFWLVISLWNLSHPFVYGSIWDRDQLFWLLYTLGGFLAFGGILGYLYGRRQSPT